MIVKFLGFQVPPYRDHVVVMIGNRYRKFAIGEEAEVDPEFGYKLLATKEFVEVKEQPKSRTNSAPAAPNRAILDGKAE